MPFAFAIPSFSVWGPTDCELGRNTLRLKPPFDGPGRPLQPSPCRRPRPPGSVENLWDAETSPGTTYAGLFSFAKNVGYEIEQLDNTWLDALILLALSNYLGRYWTVIWWAHQDSNLEPKDSRTPTVSRRRGLSLHPQF